MKEIFIVVSSLKTGGAEMQSVWLANNFSKNNFKTNLIVLKQGIEIDHLLDKKVNLIEFNMYVNNPEKSFRILRILYNFYSAYKNFRFLLKKNNEAIVFSFLFHSNVLSFLSSLFLNNKHYLCIRNDRFSSRASIKNLKIRYLIVFIISLFSSGLIFNSRKSLDTLGTKLPKSTKKYFIPNSVFIPQELEDREVVKKITNFLNESELSILSVGRLEKLKNYENLIKAVENLIKVGTNVKYIIFGQGYQEEKLNNYIQSNNLTNNILLLGLVPNAYNYYKYFNYFVIGSFHEGYPNSLIEAMDNGLVSFGTDCGDTFFILDQNRGVKIEGYGYKEIENTLLNQLRQKELNKNISKTAENYIKKELSDEVIFEKWKKIL